MKSAGIEISRNYDTIPRVLLVATLPWIFPVKFAISLRNIGFEVEAACPAGHVFRTLARPLKMYKLRVINEDTDLLNALRVSSPKLIIPCDDRAVLLLHKLHRESQDETVRFLIEVSLGRSESYACIASKSQVISLAKRLGLATPKSEPVATTVELATVLARLHYPQVLKRDGTWSGKGVRIINSAVEADMAWRQLCEWPNAFTAVKLAYFEGLRVLFDYMSKKANTIDCQQFVPGPSANRVSLFVNGKEIAGINLLARETAFGPTGPSSVVQLIDNQQMAETAQRLGESLGLSGFCGFDFIISDFDGGAYLLEANPRLTPSVNLAFTGVPYLPQELFKQLTGQEGRAPYMIANGDTVAFFPDELGRDPNSPHLTQAFHDVPREEPGLVEFGYRYIARRKAILRNRRIIKKISSVLMGRRQLWPRQAADQPMQHNPVIGTPGDGQDKTINGSDVS